jgi:hypothetical protein
MRIKMMVAGLLLASPLAAQNAEVQQKVAEFKQMLAQNQQQRRKFTWLETTQVAYQGEVKLTKVADCQYTPEGPKPMCNQLEITQAPLPSGFIRKRIAEKKGAEMKAYMDSVRTLILEYVPPQGAMIEKAYQAGNVAVGVDPEAGTKKLVISNYKQKGDQLVITWNATTKKITWIKLKTWLNDPSEVVTLNVQFSTLPNGVFYAYQKVLIASGGQITVTVTSSDFSEVLAQ